MDSDEPVLKPNANRFVLFPIQFQDLYDRYKKLQASFWTVEEIDFSQDHKDFLMLESSERLFIETVLGFFAASDGLLIDNLATRFLNEIQIPEARQFYACQIHNEAIHSETYSLLIDTLVKDTLRKTALFKSIETSPSIRQKALWTSKFIESHTVPFGERLVAFAVVEGVFFSASFAAIYWLKKRGKMPGLTFSNELIARDESEHCDFACALFGYLKHKPSQDTVHQLFREALECERAFIHEALPVPLVGMNAKSMLDYVFFIADRLLTVLGYEKLHPNVKNPFDFMDMIGLAAKTNFFEKRVSEYKRKMLQPLPSAPNDQDQYWKSLDSEDF